MTSDAENARDLMMQFTGAPFQVTRPDSESPISRKKPKWYVSCPDAAYLEKTSHADVVWADSDGNIRIESFDFGSTTEWVQARYGEEGAIKAMAFDYRQSAEEVVRTKLAKEFPLVRQRLEECDRIIARVSSEKGVRLELVVEGMERTAWFKLGAVVAWKPDWVSNEKSIEAAVGALKEAYDAVLELGRRKD